MDSPSCAPKRTARRRRRGDVKRRFDTSVPSPCISVCTIDDASGHCRGCYRTIDEIRDWPIMTADEKRSVLARTATRKAENPDTGDSKSKTR